MQFLEYGINHDKTILFLHSGISINHPDLYVEKMYRLIEQL